MCRAGGRPAGAQRAGGSGGAGGLLREAPARALFAESGGVALLAPLLRARPRRGGARRAGAPAAVRGRPVRLAADLLPAGGAAMASSRITARPGRPGAHHAQKEKVRRRLTLTLHCMPDGAGVHCAQEKA